MTDNLLELPFSDLTPDVLLDAVESTGLLCSGHFLALNSYENRVYQVGIEDSPSVVVKFYRSNRWSDLAIKEEHQFTIDLALAEIPVIAPNINEKRETLIHFKTHRFSIYPCRGGYVPDLESPDHLEQLGRYIGRIHAMGVTKKFSHRPTFEIDSFIVKPAQFLIEKNFIPGHLIDSYQAIIRDLQIPVERVFNQFEESKFLRIHGDCHPGNIIWTDAGPHIVDFDDARMGPAIQDLWMFLSGDRQFMTARLGDLLEGYTQFFDFNALELRLIEPLRTMRMVHYAYWLASRWHDPAFPRSFPWFNTTRYWEEHILALKEQLFLVDEPPLVWD